MSGAIHMRPVSRVVWILLMAGGVMVLIAVLAALRPGPSQPYVAVPAMTAEQVVTAGGRYALPWVEVGVCGDPLPAGCVAVESLAPGSATLRFERFEVKDGTLQPSGFDYTAQVTRAGLSFPLYTLVEGNETLWVYAALVGQTGDAATVRFLKLPAFVTEAAALYWDITLDAVRGRYREATRLETTEPITLIGLRDMGRVFPGARLRGVWVNGARVRFPYEGILNLNLPPGEHEVVAEVAWEPQGSAPVCLGPVYEGRKMSLPRRTDLRIVGGEGATITLRPIGLPPAAWQDISLVLAEEPAPLARRESEQGITLTFGGDARLSLVPVIVREAATFPVLVCVSFGAAGS